MNVEKSKINGIEVSRLGLGCMRMSVNLKSKRSESIKTIHAALDSGINFINTGDFYGVAGHNEKLLAEALKGYKRDQAFVSLKYGGFNPLKGMSHMDVGPQNMKKYLTKSLKRLDLDYVDLYQPARIDSGIPIEETIGALADLVKAGYVKNIGLSEVDAQTLKKANEIHQVSLVELEMSILNNSVDEELLPVTKELGIGIIGFGALGFGKLTKMDGDPLIETIHQIAAEKNISIAQFAHAWLLSKGDHVIPLVGARTVNQLEDSIQCLNVKFSMDEMERIERAMLNSNVLGPGMPKLIVKNGKIVR